MNRRHMLGLIGAAGLARPAMAGSLFGSERRLPLLIGGSSTMLYFTQTLVDAFIGVRRDADVVVAGGGSAPALMALKRGAIDLAAMDMDITVAQDEISIHNYLIARDAIGLVVNADNPVTNLSRYQVAGLFDGTISNWREVGGSDAPVQVFARTTKAATRIAADALILDGGALAPDATITAEAADLVAAVAATPNAIGYLLPRDFSADVKLLTVGGTEIRRETILSGRYPLTRSFYYVMRGDGPPSALAFLEFAIGPQGRSILAELDLVPAF